MLLYKVGDGCAGAAPEGVKIWDSDLRVKMFDKFLWISVLLHASASYAQIEPVDFLVPQVSSLVGQPVRAQVNLGRLDARFGMVSVVVADEESFAAFGVRRYQVLNALSLDLRDNAVGEFVLDIFSDQPVYEPSLRFIVEVEDGAGLRQIPIELLLPTEDSAGRERRLLLSRPNDTLWRIANRTRDDSVTNDQQMLAVQRLNPQAFRASNINGLKSWNMLALPLFEEAVTVSRRRAAEEVATQNSSWRAEQALAGVIALPKKELVQDEGDVRITAVEEPITDDETSAFDAADSRFLAGLDAMGPTASEEEIILETLLKTNDRTSERSSERSSEFEAPSDTRPPEVATVAPATPSSNVMSDAETAADAFDLEKLEAQVREEEAGALSRLLDRVMTPSSVGALAAILIAAAVLLLMLRRRAAQQEQALEDVLGNASESAGATPPQEDDDSQDATDLDEIREDVYTTRLKLAEAFIEMGDKEGAHGMLEEVIADGSPDQQAVARRILDRLENGDG